MHLGTDIVFELGMLAESVNQSASVLSRHWWSIYKKMFSGEMIFHLKRIRKRLCYYKWKAWFKLLTNSGLEIFLHFSRKHQTFFWGAQNIVHKNNFVAILLKGKIWKFIFSRRVVNWHIQQIVKAHFRCTIWFMISGKSIKWCTFLHRGASVQQ